MLQRETATSTFLRNVWYVAGWSKDVSDSLVGRTILNEPVVFFRDTAGAVCAISDRCPHRFAPLHLGKHFGDVIECGYHGLRFDSTGSCVFNPQGGKIPPSARVTSYPCIERYDLIWIWMGSAEPDESTTPDMSFITDPRFETASGGYLHADCNYQLYIDNLLDLTHAQFLHPSTLGSATISSDSVVKIRQENTTLFVDRLVPNTPGAPRYDELLGANGAPIDHWIDMRWDPPGVMRLNVGAAFPSQPREHGVNIMPRIWSRLKHRARPIISFQQHDNSMSTTTKKPGSMPGSSISFLRTRTSRCSKHSKKICRVRTSLRPIR